MSITTDRTALYAKCEYYAANKKEFHKVAKKLLRRAAKLLEPVYGDYQVRSCLGGMAVPGEVILHMERVYIMVGGQPSLMGNRILVRSCEGLRDYTGGPNQYIKGIDTLLHAQLFADSVQQLPYMRGPTAGSLTG